MRKKPAFLCLLIACYALHVVALAPCNAQEDDQSNRRTGWIRVETTKPPAEQLSGQSALIREYGLKRDDVGALGELPGIVESVPWKTFPAETRRGENAVVTNVVGATPQLAQWLDAPIDMGRFLADSDTRNRNNVAVIGNEVADRLFEAEFAVGNEIRIGDEYFTVIGVVRSPDEDSRPNIGAFATSFGVYIPITTMISRFGDQIMDSQSGSVEIEKIELSGLMIRVEREENARATARLIERMLTNRHEYDDFRVTIER